jgi:hypothetical protein
LREIFAKHVLAVRLLVASAGATFILLSSLLVRPGTQPSLALFSLGTAAMTSAFITVLTSALGADLPSIIDQRMNFQKNVAERGLEAVHIRLGEEEIFKMIDSSRELEIMYASGMSFVYRHGRTIAESVKKNSCKVRILVLHPNNDLFGSTAHMNALCPGTDLRAEVLSVVAHIEYLMKGILIKSSTAPLVEVRGYHCAPTSSVVIIDGKACRHTPYLPYSHSSEVPVFDSTKVKAPGLLEQYSALFERVWQESDELLSLSRT